MSDKIIRDKMIETLGTSILNQLNLNGLIEAAKSYSIQLEEKLVEHIEKADAEAAENESGEAEVAETEVVA